MATEDIVVWGHKWKLVGFKRYQLLQFVLVDSGAVSQTRWSVCARTGRDPLALGPTHERCLEKLYENLEEMLDDARFLIQ